MRYAFHVRRKSGDWETEMKIHHGEMPTKGDTVEVTLHDERVKVRVGVVTTPASKDHGDPVIEVHADEI